ncbi:hypothetical protein N7G274_003389 [Stereocaulon virgatum]|uniref:RTA1-like protein n=1 Tax=Stereocaulon virgatum TaxID=373712 RepID=A0ABR4AEJ1_9LECA
MPNSASTNAGMTQWDQYDYKPSLLAAVIAVAAFTTLGIIHIYQYLRYGSWFLYLLLAGVCMEIAGYWARVYSIKHSDNLGIHALDYYLTMLAPSVLAAACYMVFGRLVYWVTPPSHRSFHQLWLPPRFLAPCFITLSVVSLTAQLVGILFLTDIMMSIDTSPQRHKDNTNIGIQILRAGLMFQMAIFGGFTALGIRFAYVRRRWVHVSPVAGVECWRIMAWMIRGVCTIISLRTLSRIFEFTLSDGRSYITHHEWTLYCFDALPMILVIALFGVAHPGRYLPTDYTTLFHTVKKKTSGQKDKETDAWEVIRHQELVLASKSRCVAHF